MGGPELARTALCLSGGGFRALHWHIGGLRAANEQGLLPRLDLISGVSAGALVAAWLGLAWPRLEFDAAGRATNLEAAAIAPLRSLAQLRIGIGASVASFSAWPGWANRLLAGELDRQLFHGARSCELGSSPRVLLGAVCLDTAQRVLISAAGVEHGEFGRHPAPGLTLAASVAASCAFTPFFAPALVDLAPDRWERGRGPARLALADGVLQDVTGMAAVWDSCSTLLVSDASLPRKYPTALHPAWHSVLIHSQRVQFQQSRAVRLERLGQALGSSHRGAYWGLGGTLAAAGRVAEPADADEAQLWRIAANFLRLPLDSQELLERLAYRRAGEALEGLESGSAAS